MHKAAFLGYLTVLNYHPSLMFLTDEEEEIGKRSIMGCLMEVAGVLERATDRPMAAKVLELIRKREEINGVVGASESDLAAATRLASDAVLEYYLNYIG